ncbi:hypothetical protein L218DRAFT_410156 [Marasmius fiardii PR-910]|nr:hypothetical protein L218DRAFT_410156 [Marasmius fiardii PR-910]
MAKLTIQIPSTTYTHTHTSSISPNPLPIPSSAKDSSSSTAKTSTYPYSHRPPSPCSTDTDSDSMLSLEVADAPPSPSPRHVGDSGYQYGCEGISTLTGQNSSPCKPLAPTSTWDYGSGSSPTHLQSSSSNSWIPRANYELSSDSLFSGNQFQDNRGRIETNANLPLPNPHPPSTSFSNALSNLNNPLPYPRTPSASSSTSSKSVSSASSNSNSSYVTSASNTSVADYLRPPSSPNGFKARTPSPLGERRGQTPSPLSSNGSLSPSPAPRLAHRISSPSPLSGSFFLANGDPRSGILPQSPNREDSSDPSFSSNRAASPLKRLPSTSSSSLLNNTSPQALNPYHGLHMQRSESPTPLDDTPKASGKIRLVGNRNGNIHHGEESSPTRSHSPLPFHVKPLPVPGGFQPSSHLSLQQPIPQPPLTRSQTPRSFSRSEHDLTRVSSPGPTRSHSRTGTRLPVPPTLMPAHHRNSSSTSLVSSMSGYTGGVSGGMAGNRPLSGFIGDLAFGGPSPTSPSFHPNSLGGGNGNGGHRRTGSGSGSFASGHRRATSHDNNGVGVECQRTGSSAISWVGCGQGQGYAPSVATTGRRSGSGSGSSGSFGGQGHVRTPSNGSWVPASAFEGVGNTLPPPPPRRHGHVRSHSYDHVPLPQPTQEKKEKEEEDETIFTGFGGVGRPTPSPSSSPVSPSFPPQSRPLPVPTPRHPSRSSSSFIVPQQRPYSAMGGYAYAPSFSHSEVHLKSQSTGGLSLVGTDPMGMFIGSQSTGTASSWFGSQPTGAGSFYSSLPPSVVEDHQGESPARMTELDGVGSSPTSRNGRKKLTKSPFGKGNREGSPTKSGGGSGFKLFGKKKGKGIVNGDGVLVTGIGGSGGVEDKTKDKGKRSSPLKKLGISLRSLSPRKQQTKEVAKAEGLIWSNPS